MTSLSDGQQVMTTEPMYKSLGRVNVEEYVTVKLISGTKESSNYSTWKPQMENLIKSHQLMGFIEVTWRDEFRDYDTWMMDKVVKWWFDCTISDPKLIAWVRECDTAREVWLGLKNTFRDESLYNAYQEESESEDEGIEDTLEDRYFKFQIPMLKAALQGDWDEAERILKDYPHAAHNIIDDVSQLTPLAYAVRTRNANHFIEKLLAHMSDDEFVAFQDVNGYTALHFAATVGNEEAAAILVERIPSLCYIPTKLGGNFPIQTAALCAQRKTLRYLMNATKDDTDTNPYADFSGLKLLISTIDAEFFDIGLELVEKYPYLAAMQLNDPEGTSALRRIISKWTVLSNQRCLTFWERFISSLFPKLNDMVWKILFKLVPYIRKIKEKSRVYNEALQLVKLLCTKLKSVGNSDQARRIYDTAIVNAAELDVGDVVETILDIFPLALFAFHNISRQYIFHRAIQCRSQDVFNLIYQMSNHSNYFSAISDGNLNNVLHLAAKLAPSHKLEEISGAALQMQRELQWFKEVGKSALPNAREERNDEGMTPNEVFTKEHKMLKEKGEKWMKDTANSCTISGALIATVMFAAAITVPGGNKSDNGYPIFYHEPAFTIFAVSDAISLCSSITSLLLFLGILTSRYAEEDFLMILPKRLIFGLGSLFLSITSMMIAFGATFCLVSGQSGRHWVLFLMLLIACLPATSFVLLQFPLLADLICTTYGPGIFGKKSNCLLF